MIAYLNEEREEEFHQFVHCHEKGHFLQTKLWAKVKEHWKNEVVLSLDEEGNIVGSLSILIRKVPIFPVSILYAPRGPVCDLENEQVFSELIEGAKALAKKYRGYVLKIDPDVSIWDKSFAALVQKLGFQVKNDSKNFEGIQPRYVFRLNLTGKTEEEVMANIHSKTRYNIRLAKRKGVETRVGTREDLKRFHEIMIETGQRDEFVIRSLSYFESMFDSLGAEHLRLYMASHEGEDISCTLAVYFGNKVWYLYGASSNHKRNLMPNYLLQWEMILWALEKECELYDFRGVSGDLSEDNPLYGLYRFKKGFGGEFTEFIGELELVFHPLLNWLVNTAEKIFREARRRIYLLRGKK